VAICYRTSEADAKETFKAIEELGGKAYSQKCDVSQPEAAAGLVKNVEKNGDG